MDPLRLFFALLAFLIVQLVCAQSAGDDLVDDEMLHLDAQDPLRSVIRSYVLVSLLVVAFIMGTRELLCVCLRGKDYEAAMKSNGVNSIRMLAGRVNPTILYLCVMVCNAIVYCCLSAIFQYSYAGHAPHGAAHSSCEWILGFIGAIMESLGLAVLRHKISQRQSVQGISGQCLLMFSISYTWRLWQLVPKNLSLRLLNSWMLESFALLSLVQVLDIVHAVFRTYRHTYQQDLDVLKTQRLLPIVWATAILMHPLLVEGHLRSVFWACCFYTDVVALLPQVVMMAQSGGRIEAPISHFVAATAISRTIDLCLWISDHEVGQQGYVKGFNYSGWLIVLMHVLSLLLVADFMWYYVKARLAAVSLSSDLDLELNV